MDKWNAEPLKGVNALRFGMKREQVRSLFGEYQEFRKSKYSRNTADDFRTCHVFYDESDACEAIEIFQGVEVYVDSCLIFPADINAVREIIPDLMKDQDSFISESCSIGIYAPDGIAESILFGVKNYYK